MNFEEEAFPFDIDEFAVVKFDPSSLEDRFEQKDQKRKEYAQKYENANLKSMTQEEREKLYKQISVQKRKRNKVKYRKRKRAQHEEMLQIANLSVSEKIERSKQFSKERNERIAKGLKEGIKIGFDLSYDHVMSKNENLSLGFQLCHVYNVVKRSQNLLSLNMCGVKGMLKNELAKFGSAYWIANLTEDSVDVYFKDRIQDIIYLSPDADEELTEFEMDKIYVIGGLVDKTILKDQSKNRAKELNLASKRLPFSLVKNASNYRKCLNINTIVEIIDFYLSTKDIVQAMEKALSIKYFDEGAKPEKCKGKNDVEENDNETQNQ